MLSSEYFILYILLYYSLDRGERPYKYVYTFLQISPVSVLSANFYPRHAKEIFHKTSYTFILKLMKHFLLSNVDPVPDA